MSAAGDGLLLIDKPAGPTSHDVVARVRRALQRRRVGHGGTLDPLASGLLPVVVGRATRLVRFLPHSPKDYSGTFRLGWRSLTDDVTGEPLERHGGPLPDVAAVARAARGLEGRGLQVPPAISARRIAGQRLYRINREGERIRAAPAEVEILRFEVEPTSESGLYRFHARVTAGTYVRALVRDLGSELGCGGVLATLRRTAIGPMTPSPELRLDPQRPPDPTTLEGALIPLERMPLEPPALRLEQESDVSRFVGGAAIPAGAARGLWAVFGPNGRLLGIAEGADGRLHPRVVVAAPA